MRRTEHLTRAVPAEVLKTTPLDIDPKLVGSTVHVEYRIGDNGRVDPDSVRMVASADATPDDIALHVEAARTLHAYAGLLGTVLEGIESLRSIAGSRQTAEQGSSAWEAQLEFAKLNDIIRARLERISKLPVDEARAVDLASDLANLRSQLEDAQRILAGGEPDAAPRGFIAAQSPEQRLAANRDTVKRRKIAAVTIAGDGTVAVHEHGAPARRVKIRRRATPSAKQGAEGRQHHPGPPIGLFGPAAGGHSAWRPLVRRTVRRRPRDQRRPPQQHPRAARHLPSTPPRACLPAGWGRLAASTRRGIAQPVPTHCHRGRETGARAER